MDLPNEGAPQFPYAIDYYNRRYGPRGWTNAVVLNLSIGQGENSQNVLQMARFYTALATDGKAVKPHIARRPPEREQIFNLTAQQLAGLREAMAGVVSARGTAGSAAIQGVILAGKTGTAQQHEVGKNDHAWFVGFAPANDPKIVVSVVLEYGVHGYYAARVASKIIAKYLGVVPTELIQTEGD